MDEIRRASIIRLPSGIPGSQKSDLVKINVAGQNFEISDALLLAHPDTLLGNRAQRSKYFDKEKGHYFFDSHPQAFLDILYYYQSYGTIIEKSINIPGIVFMNEVEFWQIPFVVNKAESYKCGEV